MSKNKGLAFGEGAFAEGKGIAIGQGVYAAPGQVVISGGVQINGSSIRLFCPVCCQYQELDQKTGKLIHIKPCK